MRAIDDFALSRSSKSKSDSTDIGEGVSHHMSPQTGSVRLLATGVGGHA